MIDKIHIKNFRKHKDTFIEFDKGITCIAGKNQVGKSTVLEALLWVKDNRPLGDDYVSHDARNKKGKQILDCEVTVTKGTDVLTRKKSGSFNGYILNGVEYDAIGTSVPDEVTAFFNLSVENVQKQNEPHFLINDTGSAVAKYFNEIIDLSVIDRAREMASGLVRKTKNTQKAAEDNLFLCQCDLKLIPDLDLLDNLIEGIEGATKEQAALQNDCVQIERSCVLIRDWMNELIAIPNIKLLETQHAELVRTTQEASELNKTIINLGELVQTQKISYLALSEIPNIKCLQEKYAGITEQTTELQKASARVSLLSGLLQERVGLVQEQSKMPMDRCVALYNEITTIQPQHSAIRVEIIDLATKMHATEWLVLQKDKLIGIKVSLDDINRLEAISGDIRALNDFVQQIVALKQAESAVLEELAEIRANFPDVCPMCGNPIDKESICVA